MISQILTGLTTGAAYALIAVGVVLIFKGAKVLSIAQGELGAFGLFIGLRWAERGIPGLGWHIPVLGALVVAVVIGAAAGSLTERFIIRRLVGRPPLDALIATMGIALFLALLEVELFGATIQRAPSAVGNFRMTLFGATFTAPRIMALVLAGAVAGALYTFFARSKFGLAVLATTSDPDVARLLGVPVNRVWQFVWIVGGALSGLAASLLASAFGGLSPFGQTRFAMKALAGSVIGGLDSIWGAIVGSLIVGVVETVVASQVDITGARELAVLLLVIGTLVFRPQGLLGDKGAR